MDGSGRLADLVRRLYGAFGRDPIPSRELYLLLADFDPLTIGSDLTPRRYESFVGTLVGFGYLSNTASALQLTDKAVLLAAGFDDEGSRFRSDAERVSFRHHSDALTGASVPEQQLHAVTRRFLEEVLVEADVPAELLDVIVHTYQLRGRLTMSEDGGRYVITLSAEPGASSRDNC